VPHIGILERDFVVIPLLDLDADLHINDQPLKNLELIQLALEFQCVAQLSAHFEFFHHHI
jgi:7,8-dihydro-6-hydroxymethylpterin-pyrophosphokinase